MPTSANASATHCAARSHSSRGATDSSATDWNATSSARSRLARGMRSATALRRSSFMAAHHCTASGYGPPISDVSANWEGGHPWSHVYDFFVERELFRSTLGWLLFGTDGRMWNRIVSSIGEVPDGGSILDVPCGGGVALRGLDPDQDVRYVAADISPQMLDRTARAAEKRGLTQVQTQSADIEQLPFDDGEFDLVVSLTGLHCVSHPDAAVKELARCLKPDGLLAGSMFATDSGVRYTPHVVAGRAIGMMGPGGGLADLERWLREAGLENITTERSGALLYFR